MIRGDVVFQCSSLEDFVVVKSSGAPLFVLANVVDDITMGITHVIRGEDLLPSTPKGLLLWEALEGPGATLPMFAHLPLLVNAKRQKLSKRRDTVAVETYRDEGYLADAMRNYLALLGWSHPGGREILSAAELVADFRLEDVNHSPAFFDVEKLRWLNGEYIRAMSVDDFIAAARPWTSAAGGALDGRPLRRGGLPRHGPARPGAGGGALRGDGHGRLPLPGDAGHRRRRRGRSWPPTPRPPPSWRGRSTPTGTVPGRPIR